MARHRWAAGLARVLQHPRSAWTFLALSVAATALAWWISDRAQAERVRDRFTFRTVEIESAISRRMLECENVLRGGSGLFAASEGVTRAEWRTYVSRLHIDEYYPGIQGIGFSARLPAGGLEAHERAVRAEGFPDYAVRPPGPRPEHHAIVFLEPFSGRNLRAFGYDMFSEPTRRAAMERARDTGLPSVSGVVKLVQETEQDVQRGFLIYVPVYRNGAPVGTTEERRAALQGFVYSPFRSRDLMAGILGNEIVDVDWWIHDGGGPAGGELLFASNATAPWPPPPGLSRSVAVERGGRRWTLDFAPRAGWVSPEDRSQPLVVAVGGLVIDLLLFAIIGMQRRGAATARRMTDELKASLREKDVLLKEVHHRVKNNLQVVSSLLSLQGRRMGDARSREVLDQCRSRVLSMALVHEKLYLSRDLSRVDLAEYVGSLLVELRRGQADGRVQVSHRAEQVWMGLERAIPCGLILNELVSNALKHAFPDGRTGRVEVVLAALGVDRVELQVNDDGVGMPAAVDVGRTPSLGLEVVAALVGQLGAEIEVAREGGTRIRIAIPLPAAAGAAAS
jgi:two-component sensor histidine kinase/CHASE1-domain containing sensor protein